MVIVKIVLGGLLAMSLGSGCRSDKSDQPDPINPIINYQLQVKRHITTPLSSPRTDTILKEMSSIIQTIETSEDFPCPIGLSRDGEVATFSVGSGTINSEEDYDAVNTLPGNVKVVNQINWCSGFAPNIIGCAPVPGDSLVVVRFDENQEEILWLHEFGHNKGLFHRNDQFAVMNGAIGVDRKEVNEKECDVYLELSSSAPAFQALMSGKQRLSVEDFVHQTFFHGVPYEEANQYGSKDVPILLAMLKDPKEEKYWSNVVVTLGIIGDDRGVDALIHFIDEDAQGKLSRDHFTAKTSAVMALGYLINKSGNKKALKFLSDCTSPHFWEQMNMNWKSPFHSNDEDRDIQMSTTAILGLALCGREEATEILKQVQSKSSTNAVDKRFQKQTSGLVQDALSTCETIAKKGLKGYYRKQKK